MFNVHTLSCVSTFYAWLGLPIVKVNLKKYFMVDFEIKFWTINVAVMVRVDF